MQLDKTWRRSSFSPADGACVEVRQRDDGLVEVRDGKDGDGGPTLWFEPKSWLEFTDCVAIGIFTAALLSDEWLAPGGFEAKTGCPEVRVVDDTVHMRSRTLGDKPTLSFTRREWDAFEAAVEHGQFIPA